MSTTCKTNINVVYMQYKFRAKKNKKQKMIKEKDILIRIKQETKQKANGRANN